MKKIFTILILVFCFAGYAFAQTIGHIKLNGKIISVGEFFNIPELGDTQAFAIKLVAIESPDSIKIEYPDILTGDAEGDPGACQPGQNKRYVMRVSKGSCLSTNTCDGGTSVCFSSFRLEEGMLRIEYKSNIEDSGE